VSYSPFIKRRKQIVSKNDDLFDILRDSQTWLSTSELIAYPSSVPEEYLYFPDEYNFESCLFTKDDSEVIARHRNWEDAVEYHMHIAKGYGLTIHEERVIV
jgi:hypothetical protein